MFFGMIVSTVGSSMIWPFMTIYASQKLDLPLTAIGGLLSINAASSMISAILAGPVVDTVGRKWMMALGLAANGLGYLLLSQAETFPQFVILMGMNGLANPLYRVAADAMLADLVPPEQRTNAYAMLRLSNNLGISIGPVIGGFVAARSYTIAFIAAAAGLAIYALLISFLARETIPHIQPQAEADPAGSPTKQQKGLGKRLLENLIGYRTVIGDGKFMRFVLVFMLVQCCAVLIWVLMPVHARQNYGVLENEYGWIASSNALMVVVLQIGVTNIFRRYPPLAVLSIGAALYGLSNYMVGLAQNFNGFLAAMLVMTCGELLLMPTSSTYTANLAPAEKRGRYMSFYGLSWPAASGIAPLAGGLLNDQFGPGALWLGGLAVGLAAALIYAVYQMREGRYNSL